MKKIDENLILAAQKSWADGIVDIGALYKADKPYELFVEQFLIEQYCFKENKVLFKPTLACAVPFRNTLALAKSYFIGNDIPEDKGFALKPWSKVVFDNNRMLVDDKTAFAVGRYIFTDYNGSQITVDYSFGYILVNDSLKIFLHHSSLVPVV